ncbi:MAG: N-acetyl-gamma-glutamyl-phosphate reductase [Caenispirillum bisanense]|nr:N-acetyl-gamma-glutamyl-phosphate reductase [Caenispirillum bisanense]MCA1973426.1 N-acetyl-gamma-glutamyl-phosphate reductase [Caenispirillum sp.]
MSAKTKVAILGASGYTGAELVRILALHPHVEMTVLTADRRAGKPFADVFPHLAGIRLPDLVAIDQVDWAGVDFVFCALPHGTTQEVVAGLPAHVKCCDLSADFRLKDTAAYARYYGHEHLAPELQKEVVYGLTEIYREQIKAARVVANPGCYPTSAQLPLMPLIEKGLIAADGIIVDAKSGVTGAGRAPKEGTLFSEVTEGIHPYGIATHRHAPEIEQGLSEAAGRPVLVNFTPHLMPMARGILSTIYVQCAEGVTASDLRAALAERYAGEPFVRVLPEGQVPATRHVRGSNFVLMNAFDDRLPGRAILTCVEDNLVKGASGQAVQNMNVMLGFEETTALMQQPMFP